jgi:hypothetical protein
MALDTHALKAVHVWLKPVSNEGPFNFMSGKVFRPISHRIAAGGMKHSM